LDPTNHDQVSDSTCRRKIRAVLQLAINIAASSTMADTFFALPITYDDKTKTVVCSHHLLAVCPKCHIDMTSLNQLSRAFNSLPSEAKAPPTPAKPPNPQRTAQIAKLKDSGNAAFKAQKYSEAVRFYTIAIDMALARPPWEASALCRDETVILLCNRSATRFAMNDFPESLADAEVCVDLKKPWPKGYFRKARALQAMGRLEEAQVAIELGLMYDPNDNECNIALREIKKALEARGT